MNNNYDMVIIGGGIVGASTAMQYLERNPGHTALLLEKEAGPAMHQTGHNSGVIHAGVYYAPGSLKADFCRRGREATIEFCERHKIAYDQCGKLIVATDEKELKKLDALFTNSIINGLTVRWVESEELSILEPNINGIRAFLVADSAITDYPAITTQMIENFVNAGGEVRYNSTVTRLEEDQSAVTIFLGEEKTQSSFLIACAGLQADRVAAMIGLKTDFQIVPFKGEYFKLPREKSNVVKHLIYPVPDPDMPFLGVHLTNMIDGSVTVGPNAVLGFDREGYKKLSLNFKDVTSMVLFGGFWRVILANLKSGIQEMRNSIWKPGYLKLVQRYCPSIELNDLEAYPPGIRAQAVMNSGELVNDFLFKNTNRSLHVCNAPSPAATSAIPIGAYICDQVESKRN
jgi:L-2-hydroxyglutarate oxidase